MGHLKAHPKMLKSVANNGRAKPDESVNMNKCLPCFQWLSRWEWTVILKELPPKRDHKKWNIIIEKYARMCAEYVLFGVVAIIRLPHSVRYCSTCSDAYRTIQPKDPTEITLFSFFDKFIRTTDATKVSFCVAAWNITAMVKLYFSLCFFLNCAVLKDFVWIMLAMETNGCRNRMCIFVSA